jgi:hypothetical protein
MVVKKQLKTIPTTFLSSISWILNVVIYSKAIVRQDFGGFDSYLHLYLFTDIKPFQHRTHIYSNTTRRTRGSFFERSRITLDKWLYVTYLWNQGTKVNSVESIDWRMIQREWYGVSDIFGWHSAIQNHL